jgi:hypothetical protein
MLSYGEVLTTIGVAVTAITLPLIYLQIRNSKQASIADFTLRFCYDIFHSTYMIKKRVELATVLDKSPHDFVGIEKAREPLDVFEDVGLLLRLKVLDKRVVWCSLGYWIINYWKLVRDYVKWAREGNPLYFRYFEELYNRMLEIEAKERRAKREEVDEEKVETEFLMSEKALLP